MTAINANVNVTEKNNILICLFVEMTASRKPQKPENFNKYVYNINQFAFIWYFFHVCSFFSFVAIFFAKFWKCFDLNDASQSDEQLCLLTVV